jgi:hypothetical protein
MADTVLAFAGVVDESFESNHVSSVMENLIPFCLSDQRTH